MQRHYGMNLSFSSLNAIRHAGSIVATFLLAMLCGCVTSTAQRTATMQEEGRSSHFSAEQFGTAPPIIGMLRTTGNVETLWIVIEGDGHAWQARRQPSSDPTPIDAVGWRLARALSANAVLYLARPCQYLSADALQACSVADWTNARFAEKWVMRLNAAINEIQRSTGARHIVLTGYSGGGVMAALLAARRADVMMLITVASPLDHRAWTAMHGVSPLSGSLDVQDIRDRLFGLPQLHLVGAKDTTVPPSLLQEFLQPYPSASPTHLIVLPNLDHRMQEVIDLASVKRQVEKLPLPANAAIIENASQLGIDLSDSAK